MTRALTRRGRVAGFVLSLTTATIVLTGCNALPSGSEPEPCPSSPSATAQPSLRGDGNLTSDREVSGSVLNAKSQPIRLSDLQPGQKVKIKGSTGTETQMDKNGDIMPGGTDGISEARAIFNEIRLLP